MRLVLAVLLLAGTAAGQPVKCDAPDGYNCAVVNGVITAYIRTARPVDVPPVQEEYGNPGVNWCDMGACQWIEIDPDHPHALTPSPQRRTRLTCADKTRFLMTSEDGKKHCISLESR